MEIFSNLLLGFQTAASAANLVYCLIGVALGTAIGVLPGLGPAATIAMQVSNAMVAVAGLTADDRFACASASRVFIW